MVESWRRVCAGCGDCGDELGVVGGGPGSSPGAGTDSGGGVCREAGVMQNSRRLEIATDALSFGETQARARGRQLIMSPHPPEISARQALERTHLLLRAACSSR